MAEHLERANQFSRQLAEVYGDELISVGLYGSAARGQYREGASDLNVLVILRDLDPERLRRISPLAADWVAAGNPPPLLFSEAEWKGSADAFPIEYADIAEAHLVLHGSDPFVEVAVRWEHLRLICEHELKGRKIALRESYLMVAESREDLGALLTTSISTFIALFRAMHRLTYTRLPREPDEVVTSLASVAGFDPGPFTRILAARSGSGSFAPRADDAVVEGYLNGIARVSDWLDGLTSQPGPPTRADGE